jgi:hypothetical protein
MAGALHYGVERASVSFGGEANEDLYLGDTILDRVLRIFNEEPAFSCPHTTRDLIRLIKNVPLRQLFAK